MSNISAFIGKYRFLSNFFWTQEYVPIVFERLIFPSTEHAYQAAKSLDPKVREHFADAKLTCGKAKKDGRRIVIRPDWNDVRIRIMSYLVAQKFQNEILGAQLLETGDATLVEGNDWHDIFWGVCMGKCKKPHPEPIGENHLGQILMRIRTRLRTPEGREKICQFLKSYEQ
jgi:ribA/ribD-fused uncharacterized protein